jgi:hypothetical protein
MKRVSILLAVMMLAGCWGTIPKVPSVDKKFPDVPKELMVACPDLKLIEEGTTKFSTVLSVVKDNYAQYSECKIEVDNWIKWYNDQKEIFNAPPK